MDMAHCGNPAPVTIRTIQTIANHLVPFTNFPWIQALWDHESACNRGWQLPKEMLDYPSVTLYYPFLRGNIVTQILVMVNKLYFHYPYASHRHLNKWMSAISFYLLGAPNFSKFTLELNIICSKNNQHTHISLWYCLLMLHCPLPITPCYPQ